MLLNLERPPTWVIEETPWEPERNAVWESLCTLANGYMGIRGFPDEPFDAGPTDPGIYIAGLFQPGTDGIPELARASNFLALTVTLDDHPVRMAAESVSEYRRVLGLKRGILQRSFLYRIGWRLTRIEFERFVSLANLHVVGQAVRVTPLNWRVRAGVCLAVDSANPASQSGSPRVIHSERVGRDCVLLATQTAANKARIAHAVRCMPWVHQGLPPKPSLESRTGYIGLRYEPMLEAGQCALFTRIISTHTSRDPETISAERDCLDDIREAKGLVYGTIRRRHVQAWHRRWHCADVEIDGPEEDQRAIRFAVFHMVQSCPPHGFTLSIPAKGLSGKGYRGHVFWDTDIFMLPFFLHTDPRAARRLMDYRIHTLEGARRKARKAGHRGAMFAWESADTGDETCPPYVPDPRTGDPVRVLTGDMEQHISADVVYAAWHYIQATADVAFQEREFLKLCVLTARFWTSRVKRDRLSNLFEIPGVIGPDEYHVEVDNNAFTNYLAAWNLRIAAEQVTRLLRVHRRSRVLRDLRVQKTEVDRWFRIADRMYLPGPVYKGPWEQHQGFFNLRKTAPRRLAASRFSSEKRRAAILQKTQILKQADVVMLMTLFPDVFPVEAKRSNWNYYEPRTLHESSLSPGVHSMVASDLGLRKDAYAYFRKSALLDLNDTMGNTALGLHLGAMGGAWQAVAKGFLGLRLDANEPTFYPRLPDAWKGVALCIEHRGARFIVEATHEASRMRPCP